MAYFGQRRLAAVAGATEPQRGEAPGRLTLSSRRQDSGEVQLCYRGGAQTQRLATAKERDGKKKEESVHAVSEWAEPHTISGMSGKGD